MSKKVYEIIQQKFVDEIQKVIDGEVKMLPWEKPWNGSPSRNYVSGKTYSGINRFLLDGGEWLTFNQIKKLSEKNSEIKLKKGSKGSMVVFWKMIEKKNGKEEEKEVYPMLRYYYVYNINDIDNLESKLPVINTDPLIQEAEDIIKKYIQREKITLDIKKGNDRAFYQPSVDRIVVPDKEDFKSADHYYQTLFHEMSHSTGHESRLDRFKATNSMSFGSEVYSKEELVAELSAQMLMGMLNISSLEIERNSIAYAYGWMKAIKDDAKLIISASSLAQKSCDLILAGDFDG